MVPGLRRGEKPARVFVVSESAVPEFARSILDLTAQATEQAAFSQ